MSKVPINTTDLFLPLDKKLLELLRSLTPEEWEKPTVARLWNVKDVAAHLLDTNTRTLSMSRDHYPGINAGHIHSFEELVAFLNQLNADWVNAMKRVSPHVLTEWLASSGKAFCAHIATADLHAPASIGVAWAGEKISHNWFHIAREYTEKWHHQQQIRDAVDKPGIMTREFYYPVLDTFMMALPHTYRNTDAGDDAVVQVTITGEAGGNWYITYKGKWELSKAIARPVTAHASIDGEVAWKLFTKSWRRSDAANYITLDGDKQLAAVVLDMVSVMA
jgi:uncharacterized protein (TIGR03083 family)